MSVYSPSGSGDVHVDSVLPNVSIGTQNMPYEIRMVNGKHCVYRKGTNNSMGCSSTHEEAVSHMAALYAAEGGKMSEGSTYLIKLDSVNLSDGDATWVHALPLGTYKHPVYGVMDINAERAASYAESVKNKVRGIDPSINYNHDNNSTEGATGWVKDAQARNDGLWLFVDFVKDAAQKVRDKKFRYFSIEFANEWIDAQGKKFKDVVIGGALTNRPFMKNLVPINLSEAVVDDAFDLVSAITGKPSDELKGKETHMDEKELTAIIDGVTAKLAEKLTPPKVDPVPPVVTPIAKMEEIEDLKKLAETNPTVKALLAHFENQAVALVENSKKMRETMVDAKLSEFDNSKLTLTPATKDLAREIMLAMPDELTGKFWEFMDKVRTSQSFLVELGERSGAAVRHGYSSTDKTATQIFIERTNLLMASEKIDFLSAVERVAAEDPKLYEGYRLGDGAPASK